MSKSYLDGTGVGTLSSLMKKAIKDTVESAKEQLFVVTVTPEGKPEEQANGDVLMRYTPSVTFAEAVAQAKSGKKVVIGPDGADLDTYVRMHLTSAGGDAGDMFFSENETSFLHADTIKTFSPIMLQYFQWNSSALLLTASQTLPKWIGDTKPTYTASEVGADESGAAVRASKDMQAWVIGEGYQTAEQVSTAIENAKEQLFVVTATPKGKPTEGKFSTTTGYTPSVTFEEAVAQARSGKKVVLRIIYDSGTEDIPMHLADFESESRFFSDLRSAAGSYNNTFVTPLLAGFVWHHLSLYEESMNALPKWIGDTKPTYTASEVGAADKPKRVSVTLTASGWNSSAKTQTVTVNGVLADESAQVIQPIPALVSQSAYNAAGILATGQAANSITFTASTVPTADLSVYVVITEVTA